MNTNYHCGSVAQCLGSKGPKFDSSVRPSVVKIANHCYFYKDPFRCFARKAGPSLKAAYYSWRGLKRLDDYSQDASDSDRFNN